MAGDVVVTEWAGDVDLHTVEALRADLDRIFAAGPPESLVIDLGRVQFMDSTGVGLLVHAHNEAVAAGILMTLRDARPRTKRLLNVTGLSATFAFDDPHPSTPIRVDDLPATASLPAKEDVTFDRLAALTARVLNVPTALVSLVAQHRQVFPGAVGLPEPWQQDRATPLSHSFCQYVADRGAPLVVPDSAADPLLSQNLAVDDLGVAAYAGMPLIDHTGRVVGSLCAIDSTPRDWSDAELANLRDLADLASAELRHRALTKRAALAAEQARIIREQQTEIGSHLRSVATILHGIESDADAATSAQLNPAREHVYNALKVLDTGAGPRQS